jgi:hypothetical protein
MLRTASRLRYLYLAWLSGPSCQRRLYRLIRRQQIRSIVEIGVGRASRAVRMIEVAQGTPPAGVVRYTGIDSFELRGAGEPPGVSLKEAYRLLKPTGARVQLVPGDPLSALARVANNLLETELVIISADQDPAAMAQAWFYVPRMLGKRSVVVLEERDEANSATVLRQLASEEIAQLAGQDRTRRRAA